VLSSCVRRIRALCVVGLTLAVAPVALAAPVFDATIPELAPEIALPRWERAKAAMPHDLARLEACLAESGACLAPQRRAWRNLVHGLATEPRAAQLAGVNRFVNTVPYASDAATYGVRDYWAGPWSFLVGVGDCEDYAIAKYATLRALGIPAADMRILVVDDSLRGLAHAVLAVRDGDRTWLLDNQADRLLDARADARYVPYYAVNEERRWLYRLPERAAPAR
jgi:predicted transglutaminase-like cysteine proteinase